MNHRHFLPILLAVGALALGGCASFDRDWKNVPVVTKADPFSGRWDGVWTSAKHQQPGGPGGGRLRCIFTRVDDAHYRAQFFANWLCFASGYTVTFETKRHGDTLAFHGEQNLGAIFGGVYRYDGVVTAQHFSASFISGYDHGRFEMHRP
jgi:hypothetical protein